MLTTAKVSSFPFTFCGIGFSVSPPATFAYYWEAEKLELMPLPSMHYEYMERKTAKVSSDFHVRFDNAYYSVDKTFLHKKISIKASSTVVRIYSLTGEFLCEWPRATRKGQWSTNPEHLPDNYKGFTQWNGPYFIQKAQLIGKNTETVVRTILKSRPYEVQTYRMCLLLLFSSFAYYFLYIFH